VKNQLPTPYNVTYEGTMACVHCGILPEDQLDEYKKENSKLILQNIESLCEKENKVTTDIDENDIEYSEEEGNDNE
jgi:hypothetical protein